MAFCVSFFSFAVKVHIDPVTTTQRGSDENLAPGQSVQIVSHGRVLHRRAGMFRGQRGESQPWRSAFALRHRGDVPAYEIRMVNGEW